MSLTTICNKCNNTFENRNFKIHYDVCGVYKNCLQCGSKIFRLKKFCNNKCAAIYNNKNCENLKKSKRGPESTNPKVYKPCLKCGKPTRNEKFCCLKCNYDYSHNIYEEKVTKWINREEIYNKHKYFMKNYLLAVNNNSCSKCGWNQLHPKSKISPLHLHHKDGNYYNNFIENFEILCPNCHSLTENFGSRNVGKGNPDSRKYWRKNWNKNE